MQLRHLTSKREAQETVASQMGIDKDNRPSDGSYESGETRLWYPWPSETENSGVADSLTQFAQKTKEKARAVIKEWTLIEWLSFFIPCIEWLRTYKWKSWLLHDLVAGISVGFMVVPQGMAYANSAGLPSVYGLYGAFLPCMVYACLGSSRQLAVGPVAVTSLLIASNLQNLIPCVQGISNPNTAMTDPNLLTCQNQYNHAAIQLAFIVACMYTGVGILGLGWIIKFLSHAVIAGFTTGAAITIGLGQAKYILGYKISMGSSTRLQDYLNQYFLNIHNLRWQEFILGVMTIFILVLFKYADKIWGPLKYIKSFGSLFVCIMGIVAVIVGKIDTPDRGGVAVVGAIPSGLPGFTGSWWTPMDNPSFTDLIPTAIVVMFVDLLESTSIARALARKNGYELSFNREIIGLGIANFAGAMSNCYTTTGSFSRSAVNNNSGARTPLAQFFCGWVVAFVLLLLTGVFSKLPFAVMGAIIIVGIASLVEFEYGIYLYKVSKLDFLVFLCSCFGTLFISVELGLAIAVGMAIFITLYQSAFPHTAVLGKVSGPGYVYRSIKQYPDSQLYPGILAFRVDAPLYFANVKSVEEKIEKALVKFAAWSQVQGVSKIHFLVVDLTPVSNVDAMGVHMLEELVFETKKKGIQLMFANPSRKVIDAVEKVRLTDLLGKENIFVSVRDAMALAQQRMAEMGLAVKPLTLTSSS